jgi:VanZ family protein
LLSSIIEYTYNKGQHRYFKAFFYGLLIITYAAFLMPVSGIAEAKFNDKLAHALIFFVLIVLAHFAHTHTSVHRLVISLACYGLATEIGQGLVPYRELSVADWLADIAGLACGALAILTICRYFPQNFIPKVNQQRTTP